MIPSLFTFTLLSAAVLLVVGLPLLAFPAKVEPILRGFPRHRATGIATMIIGGGWFLVKIWQLGQSDFGDYKELLLILFGGTLIGSIYYVRDFLAVRGVAILILLSANTGLKSAFGLYDIPGRLVLVSILYVFIVAAMVYGVAPYKMRDTIAWLYAGTLRARLLGFIFTAMSSGLIVAALQY
ncbi:MAG: hypothetical protein ACO3ZW_08465 [Opitutales bacterium]